MKNRTRVAVGSALGAVAIHAMLVACGSAGGVPSAGDGGALDDVRDAIVDAMADVLDAETPDAHAGGDAGACNCVEPPSYSFSGGALLRDGMAAQEPQADFSTVTLTASPLRAADGTLTVNLGVSASYYLRDGGKVIVQCSVVARPDGTVVTRMTTATPPAAFDTKCDVLLYEGAPGSGLSAGGIESFYFSGASVPRLSAEGASVTLPSIALRGHGTLGPVSVAPITARASVPGAQWLTPPHAYQP